MSLYQTVCGGYGVKGPPGPPGPPGMGNMSWKGTYAPIVYNLGDVVSYNNINYVAVRNSPAGPPPGKLDVDWAILGYQTGGGGQLDLNGGIVDITPSTPQPGTPVNMPMQARGQLVGIGIQSNQLIAPVEGGWKMSGRLWLHTNGSTAYTATMSAWLQWVENGLTLQSQTITGTGTINPGSGSTGDYQMPVDFSIDTPANTPISLVVKAVGSLTDTPLAYGALGITMFPRPQPSPTTTTSGSVNTPGGP